MCVWYICGFPQRPEEGIESPRIGAPGSSEPSDVGAGTSGTLEELGGPLTTEPSLQTPGKRLQTKVSNSKILIVFFLN